MVSLAVGYDAAKHILGRKRHVTVDMLGLVLRVFVTAASVPERVRGQASLGEGQTNGSDRLSVAYRLG